MIKKILKKSWILILTCLSGYIFLFGITGNDVHAQEATTSTAWTVEFKKKAGEWSELGEKISQVATLALWPFVTVAGIAMDNQMVYGATFGFDSALWKIRNIAKNIANFILGFFFVYSLFSIIVKGKTEEIKKTIQNTLIAGILIQASRFITAAAVDISTIATYAIGGMPLSVMGENEQSSKYILWSKVFITTEDNKENIIVIRTTQQNTQEEGEGWNISPCKIYPYEPTNGKKEILIIGREYVYYETKANGYPTNPGVCHYQGKIYRFNENDDLTKEVKVDNSGDLEKMKAAQSTYIANTTTVITKLSDITVIQNLIEKGNIVKKEDPCNKEKSNFTWWVEQKAQFPAIWLDDKNDRIGNEGKAIKIDDLFEESKSYVGVFSTLYSTLLDSAEIGLTEGSTQNNYLKLLNTVLNIAYIAALFLPLAVMVVVLVMRVVMLWAIIALSPIIVIMKVFEWDKKLSGSLEMFKLENIISLLLAPVLISFAVSLSTMFVIILKTGVNTNFCSLEGDGNILGLFNITIEGVGANLSQLIISVLWIAIVWFLLFWAIKMNSIGKTVGSTVQKMGQEMIGNIPIIPFPGGGIGLNQINPNKSTSIFGKMNTDITKKLTQSSDQNLANIFPELYKEDMKRWENEKNNLVANMTDSQINEYINNIKNWDLNYTITAGRGLWRKIETVGLDNVFWSDKAVQQIMADNEATKKLLTNSEAVKTIVENNTAIKSIIENSKPTANGEFMENSDINPETKNKIKEAFINIIKNTTDKEELEKLLKQAQERNQMFNDLPETLKNHTWTIDKKKRKMNQRTLEPENTTP